ncbi:CTLH/CRA C-terminal to lish motif domain-containing protein [Aspergillus carlsbadensis]|nr:CTLH/CRA C-terminal to lish motif domain-containing protein [Aspergillus carlsbadensis]
MSSANYVSPTASTSTPTWHNFERKVDDVKPSKTDMNRLVMDYLVTNGYPAAAQKFAHEANIQTVDAEAIHERVEIRTAIYSGNIQSAIEKINELNPQILDENPSLHFALLRLQLVELIRSCSLDPDGDITPALEFATSQLAPRAPTNPQFLEDLEKTLALLIFPKENLTPSLAPLLHSDLRRDICAKVNAAILQNQGARTEALLCDFARLYAWAEQKAREAKKDIPDKLDLGLGDTNNSNSASHNGASNDTVMTNNGDVDPMIS